MMSSQRLSRRRAPAVSITASIAQFACALAALVMGLSASALPGRAADTIRIAVAGPAEGTKANTVRAIAEGAHDAVAALARDGLGLEIETADDGCTRDKAEETAKALVAKGVALVLGHPCPAAALAAAKIYAAANVVFIATETRHPDLTGKRAGPSVFRLAGNDAHQGEDAARLLLALAGDKPIAIVHDRTLYAKTIAENAVSALKSAKKEPITATIVGGDKEYRRLVAKIKGAGAVLFAGFPLEAGFIFAALRNAESKAAIVASESVATSEFTSSFPAEAKRAQIMLATHADSRAAARAAVEIYASARRLSRDGAGLIDVKKLIDAIASGEHETALGKIKFEKSGDAAMPAFGAGTWDGAVWGPAGATPR